MRLVVEKCFHFPRKRFWKMELSFHFQFSTKILKNAFGWNDGVFIFHFRKLENAFENFWKTAKIKVRLVTKNCFHFRRNFFKKMELSFQFSMKILENAFGWNGGVFIFLFRKVGNAFRKFWKTTKISFLIYIEVRKQKIFIFLENFWKLNETNVFFKISFSLKIIPGKLEIFSRPNAPLVF